MVVTDESDNMAGPFVRFTPWLSLGRSKVSRQRA
jgi:hypothetical protein